VTTRVEGDGPPAVLGQRFGGTGPRVPALAETMGEQDGQPARTPRFDGQGQTAAHRQPVQCLFD
jgi:hypothetical protein